MLRIILVVIRLIFLIPYWLLFEFKKYGNKEIYSFEERFIYVLHKLDTINTVGRIEVKSSGLDLLPKKEGYLITPNHQGLEDIIAIALSLEKPIKGISKIELKKVPLVSHVFDMLDCYYMDRDDVRSSMKIIKDASLDLESGKNVVVFPEGTRSKLGNELLEFKGGSFKIATKAKAPIVPVAIRDSYKVFDSNSIAKAIVYVDYLEPIYYEQYSELSTNDIALLVQNKITDHIKKTDTL